MALERIYISDEIQNLLVTNKNYHAELFLLGRNKTTGVFIKAVSLKKYGGCEMMPGIPHVTLARAFVEVTKARLNPAAFAYRTSHEPGLTSDIEHFPGVPFICSASNGFSVTKFVKKADGHRTFVKEFEVCVVDKDYDPGIGRIKKKRTLTRARSVSVKPKHKEQHRGKSNKR